jgi:hypothetical protein
MIDVIERLCYKKLASWGSNGAKGPKHALKMGRNERDCIPWIGE